LELANGNGKNQGVLMLIICGLGTVALFFAGLGYHNVDKRLCSMERKGDLTLQKIATVEFHQDQRIKRETGEVPRRPSMHDIAQ
jgi:hypothetical protein